MSDELAEMWEVVRAVATEDVIAREGDAGDWLICPFCSGDDNPSLPEHPIDGRFQHEPTCIVLKARRLFGEKLPEPIIVEAGRAEDLPEPDEPGVQRG